MGPSTLPARALVRLIGLYRAGVSPLLGPSCRYTPTCSSYAQQAIARHGAGRGSWLALRRVLRCQPFGGRGYDPVPGTGPTGTDRTGMNEVTPLRRTKAVGARRMRT